MHRAVSENARNNKTSLSKYLIPQEASLNNERLPGSLWDPAILSLSWKSLKKTPYLGGVYGPLESECNFLKYRYTFFQEERS